MKTDIEKIEKMNLKLHKEYTQFKHDLNELCKGTHDGELANFSAPLLMNINEQYISSNFRVLLVGQETCGWGKDERKKGKIDYDDIDLAEFLKSNKDRISDLVNKYDEFNFAEKDRHNAPFWRFYRDLHKALKIDLNMPHPNSIGWTNLFKFDCNRKALSPEQKSKFSAINGELLKKEIEIIEPDIILFVTGYRYDKFIKEWFFANYKPIEKGYLAHINLNLNNYTLKSFRTFHPNFLQFQKKFDKVFTLLKKHSSDDF